MSEIEAPEGTVRILDDQTVEVRLPSRFGCERVAMECSASLAKRAGMVSERIEDLKTAVSEACLNAMEHGNKGRPDAQVVVTMKHRKGAFSVTVKDEGKGRQEAPEEPDIDRKLAERQTPRGLGVYLIRQLMDQVELDERTEEGHVIRMVIRLEQPSE